MDCGVAEERPYYGADEAQGLCRQCSSTGLALLVRLYTLRNLYDRAFTVTTAAGFVSAIPVFVHYVKKSTAYASVQLPC
jgi:hypothetical protein